MNILLVILCFVELGIGVALAVWVSKLKQNVLDKTVESANNALALSRIQSNYDYLQKCHEQVISQLATSRAGADELVKRLESDKNLPTQHIIDALKSGL
jgi:hypothetical protein